MKHFFDLKQEQLLMDFLKSYNCDLSENQLSLLFQYAECVIKGNTITNLISKNDAGKFCSRHLTDSLIPVCLFKNLFDDVFCAPIYTKNEVNSLVSGLIKKIFFFEYL